MNQKKTYNGWTNYATWRVNLEYFSDLDTYDARDSYEGLSLYDLAQCIKDGTEQMISDVLPDLNNKGQLTAEGMVRGWAMAFLDEVNWREIAEHLAEDHGITLGE